MKNSKSIKKSEAPLTGPERESFWASLLFQRSSKGSKPYLAGDINPEGGGGYWLDGDDHYCPLNTFQKVQAYSKKKGLPVQDYSDQIAAALVRWRDRAVLAKYPTGKVGSETPGVPNYHTILQGIADHYIASNYTDEDDKKAADILLEPNWTESRITSNEEYFQLGGIRPDAFQLAMAVDRDRMKLGVHPAVDSFARIGLRYIDEITKTPAEKRFGVAFKPFMAGLLMWALVKYWNQYRNDPTRANLIGVIPSQIKKLANYIWDHAYIRAGTLAGGWDKGAVTYSDIPWNDPSMLPVKGVVVTDVINVDGTPSRNQFHAFSTSLSNRPEFYTNSGISFDGVVDTFLISKYDPNTDPKLFNISKYYSPGWDLKVGSTFTIRQLALDEGDGPGASPDLNHMIAPAFAWAYWHEKTILNNIDEALVYRAKFHEMWNGCSTCWQEPWGMKQYSQSALWGIDGLGWAEEADNFVKPPEFTDVAGQEITPDDLVLYTYNFRLELGVIRQTVKGWCKMQLFYTNPADETKFIQRDIACQRADVKLLKITDESSFMTPANLAAKQYRDKFKKGK